MVRYGLENSSTWLTIPKGVVERRKEGRIITITALVLAFGLGFVFTDAYAGERMSEDRFRSE